MPCKRTSHQLPLCLAPPPKHNPYPPCSAVEQLVEVSQTRAIADALVKLRRLLGSGGGGWRGRPLAQLLDALEAEMDEQVGLLCPLCRAALCRVCASWSCSWGIRLTRLWSSICLPACRAWMRWAAPSPATWRARAGLSWRQPSTGCARRSCGRCRADRLPAGWRAWLGGSVWHAHAYDELSTWAGAAQPPGWLPVAGWIRDACIGMRSSAASGHTVQAPTARVDARSPWLLPLLLLLLLERELGALLAAAVRQHSNGPRQPHTAGQLTKPTITAHSGIFQGCLQLTAPG